MKTIGTLFVMVLFTGIVSGQSAHCTLSYINNSWAIVHSDSTHRQCSELLIGSLPPLSQASTPMNLFITTMGSYSLKKDALLQLPGDYSVVVEDLLTGQYYNLNSPEPYVFKMNRGFGQTRFLMEISKNPVKLAMSSSGKP